jgi:hypothetical protein
MRVLSQYELACCTKAALSLLLYQVISKLPHLPEGSINLRNAHLNLRNIRRVLAGSEGFTRLAARQPSHASIKRRKQGGSRVNTPASVDR